MDILSVFEGAIESDQHGEIVAEFGEWLQGGSELQWSDSGLSFQASFRFDSISVKATDEVGQFGLFFAGEEAASDDAIGQVDDDHAAGWFFGGFASCSGGDRGEKGKQDGSAGAFQKVSAGMFHGEGDPGRGCVADAGGGGW